MNVIIADNQGITRAGLFYLFAEHKDAECKSVEDKAALIEQLKSCPNSVVVLDYTLNLGHDANTILTKSILRSSLNNSHFVFTYLSANTNNSEASLISNSV